MKWIIVAAVIAAAILAAVLLPRKSVHAELVVRASVDDVWDTITDTMTYNDWNPIFRNLEGTFSEGSSISLDMTVADGGQTPIDVSVTKLIPGREINQRAGIPGVLTAHHQWLIEPVSEGTRVVQHEEYRGIGVLFYNPTDAERPYREGLAALKSRLEDER